MTKKLYKQELERAILNLGTELVSMRKELAEFRSSHKQVVDMIKGLRSLLNEKGVVDTEDFDEAINWFQIEKDKLELDTDTNFSEENWTKKWIH